MKETKRERFIRVAERRTNAILEKLRILGNCSNKSMYEYDDPDVDKIFRAIKKALKETELQFKQKSSKQFRLGG
ncbi:MAG: hypothetical protein ACTSSE_16715 [Candidatus Thorarchaeota archaeon]